MYCWRKVDIEKKTNLHSLRLSSMVDSLAITRPGIRMNNTPKPLSAAAIHSIYSSKKIAPVVDQSKQFKSTNSFARDAAHSGQAPEKPKVEKKRPSRS